MSCFFTMVGPNDSPLYELEVNSTRAGGDGQSHFPPNIKELDSYIVHASLDVVDEVQWTTPSLFLKTVDKFYGYSISAFVTPGNVRLLLLHDSRNEEAIKQFFLDAWDAYVKTLLSPFYKPGDAISSPNFDAKIRQSARKFL